MYLHCTEIFSVLDMLQDDTLSILTYLLPYLRSFILSLISVCIMRIDGIVDLVRQKEFSPNFTVRQVSVNMFN